jgi:hypothetical protein
MRKQKRVAEGGAKISKSRIWNPSPALGWALAGSLGVELVASPWHSDELAPQPHREVDYPELPSTLVQISASGNVTNAAAPLVSYPGVVYLPSKK